MTVAVLAIVAAGLGSLLLPGKVFTDFEGLIYRLFFGFSACSLVVLLIGGYSLPLSQFCLLIFAALWLGYEIFLTGDRPRVQRPPTRRFTLAEWACLLTVTGSLGLALIGALAPVTAWDAAVAHAALPADYARQGRVGVVAGNEYTAYPHLLHVLFAQAYAAGGEKQLGLLNWLFAAMSCGAAYALGSRVLKDRAEGRLCGLLSAAILATAPIFIDQAGAPSIDLAFTGYTLAALAALLAWFERRDTASLIAAAILAGSSCGVRHTGYLVFALMALAILVYASPDRLRAACWFCVVAGVAALPWMVRSAMIAGSPVYPFCASLFDNGPMAHREITALAAHESVKRVALGDFLMFPWNIVMRAGMFDGWLKSPGGLVLALGVPGFFVGGHEARKLGAFSAIGGAAFYFFQRLARYMLPFFAPMMIVGAAGAVRMRSLRYVTVPALAATFLVGLGLSAAAVQFKARAALGLQDRANYLEDRVERFAAFQWVNEHVPREDLVLTLDRRTYYLVGSSWQNDEPLRRLASADPQTRLTWMRQTGVKWIFAPVTYVEESPGLREPFLAMLEEWRADKRHFKLAQRLEIARPRNPGTEIVEIYEVCDAH